MAEERRIIVSEKNEKNDSNYMQYLIGFLIFLAIAGGGYGIYELTKGKKGKTIGKEKSCEFNDDCLFGYDCVEGKCVRNDEIEDGIIDEDDVDTTTTPTTTTPTTTTPTTTTPTTTTPTTTTPTTTTPTTTTPTTTKKQLNESCNTTSDCDTGMSCSLKVCKGTTNFPCEKKDDCRSVLNCFLGKCSARRKEGESCDKEILCSDGLECKNSICVKPVVVKTETKPKEPTKKQLGENCVNSNECVIGDCINVQGIQTCMIKKDDNQSCLIGAECKTNMCNSENKCGPEPKKEMLCSNLGECTMFTLQLCAPHDHVNKWSAVSLPTDAFYQFAFGFGSIGLPQINDAFRFPYDVFPVNAFVSTETTSMVVLNYMFELKIEVEGDKNEYIMRPADPIKKRDKGVPFSFPIGFSPDTLEKIKSPIKKGTKITLKCRENLGIGALKNIVLAFAPVAPVAPSISSDERLIVYNFKPRTDSRETTSASFIRRSSKGVALNANEYFPHIVFPYNTTILDVVICTDNKKDNSKANFNLTIKQIHPTIRQNCFRGWLENTNSSDAVIMDRQPAVNLDYPEGSIIWVETSMGRSNIHSGCSNLGNRDFDKTTTTKGTNILLFCIVRI